jgi:hypothetical protein
MMKWLQTHKFQAHTLAFLLIALPPIPMYLAVQGGATGWIWPLLALVISGNLLELFLE